MILWENNGRYYLITIIVDRCIFCYKYICSDLSDKIINNYNNGNLYTTYSKVPIKLNVKYSKDWYDN